MANKHGKKGSEKHQEAIEDIEKHTGIQVTFVGYENYKLEDDDRKMR